MPVVLTPLTAVSYIRVSTARQADRGGVRDGFSIPAQREANRRQAHGLGALIAAEFVDRGQSGRNTNRPGLQQMLAYLREHQIDYVIVHKLDRLARSRADDIEITQAIQDAGARLVSTTEGIDASANGALLHGIMASIAEFYSRNLRQEVMKGMRQKVLLGGTPSRAPIGYLNVHVPTDDGREFRTVHVDSERAPHITWAFETYATGDWSVARLVVALGERGLRTRPTPSRSPAIPTTANLHKVLKNPYYKGVVTMNGVQHDGAHEPLISVTTWDAMQRVLASRRSGERSRIHTHYLKSTVDCFACERRLLVHNARSKSGRIYPYFVCSGRQKTPQCGQKAFRSADVERRVEGVYGSLEISPARRELLERLHLQRSETDASARAQELSALRGEREAIELRQAKLIDLYYGDRTPRDVLVREHHMLAEALSRIVARQERLGEGDVLRLQRARDALDLLEGAHARYATAAQHERKQMNNALFSRVLVGPASEEIRVELLPEIAEILGLDGAAAVFA